jgi:fatty-acyl-CoA synthase
MTEPIKGLPSTFQNGQELNVTDFMRSTARNLPERRIVSGISDDQFRYTYGESYERMQRLANALESLSVEPGDSVGLLAWNDYRHFETYFAIPGIGAAFLQLNLRLHPETLQYVLQHASPKYLFVDESLLSVAESLESESQSIQGYVVMTDTPLEEIESDLKPMHSYEALLEDASSHYDWPTIDEDSTASICYTAGTTGRPKAVCYSHRSNYLAAMQMANTWEVTMEDTTLVLTPMFHIQGGNIPLVGTYAGAKMVLPGKYSLDNTGALANLMVEEGVTFSSGVPLLYRQLLPNLRDEFGEDVDFGGTKFMIGGSAPSADLVAAYEDIGVEFIMGYGSTETTALITASYRKPHGVQSKDDAFEVHEKGLPLTGVHLRLSDPETGESIPHDGETVGEILVRSPWTTTMYKDDSRSADAFTDDGFWRSGDLGTVDQEGYVELIDRLKDGIKSGGEWISSVDMENKLIENPAVEDAAVVGLSHDKWGERPFAVVVESEGAAVDRGDLEALLSEEFAEWQLPDEIEYREEIPNTSVGKIDKVSLRDEYEGRYVRD